MTKYDAIKALKDHKICFEHDFGWNQTVLNALDAAIEALAVDVVARDCYDRLLAENDDMRAIIDIYGGLENIQSAFVKLHEIETADVVPVRHGHKVTHNRPIAGHWVSGKLDGGWDGMEGRVWVPPVETNPVDYCSECGKRLDDTFQHYCPNCGSMIESETNENL